MNTENRKHMISVTGDIGSGKTAVSKLMEIDLGYELYCTGKIQRDIASKYGMTTLELNLYSETHPEVDAEIDGFLKDLNSNENGILIDSRLAWHFLPQSFKVYLSVHPTVAVERIFHDKGRETEALKDPMKLGNDIQARILSENTRFKLKYGVDCRNLNNFDLIVDTSFSTPEEIASLIVRCFHGWLKGEHIHKHWISPKLLIPTQYIIVLGRESAKQVVELVRCNGFDERYPVTVTKSDGFLFINDGHRRVSAALINKISIIPIYIIAEDDQEISSGLTARKYGMSNCRKSWIYDWEDCHKFRYTAYPELDS